MQGSAGEARLADLFGGLGVQWAASLTRLFAFGALVWIWRVALVPMWTHYNVIRALDGRFPIGLPNSSTLTQQYIVCLYSI
jgi:hypothetical protein